MVNFDEIMKKATTFCSFEWGFEIAIAAFSVVLVAPRRLLVEILLKGAEICYVFHCPSSFSYLISYVISY